MKFLFILFISLAVFSSYAKVQYQFTTTTYEIKANNIDDLLIKVQQNGPKLKQHNSWAVLSWDLNTEYHFISNQQGCQLIADQISIIAEVTLPYWKNIDDNNPSVRKWWKKFTDFIKIHEDKHFTNVYKIASALEINIVK